MAIKELFENIEKVLRYLVPAFVFTILLRHFYPDIYCKYVYGSKKTEFILYFTLLGITIYSINRVIFEVIDFIVLKCAIEKGCLKFATITDFIQKICKVEEKLGKYLYFKCAMIHSVLITAELSVLFLLTSKRFNVCFWVFLLLFIVSLCVYMGYLKVQAKIVKRSSEKVDITNGY